MKYLIIFSIFLPFLAYSDEIKQINPIYCSNIVAAIYRIEGGTLTKHPFGIKSVETGGDIVKARRICVNTVRNNYIRWQKAGKTNNYLDFLADRYCPATVDKIGNLNWKKNIHRILDR